MLAESHEGLAELEAIRDEDIKPVHCQKKRKEKKSLAISTEEFLRS